MENPHYVGKIKIRDFSCGYHDFPLVVIDSPPSMDLKGYRYLILTFHLSKQ